MGNAGPLYGYPEFCRRVAYMAMLGWGLGIAFQYFDAYGSGDRQTTVEQEYEKLKRQQQSL